MMVPFIICSMKKTLFDDKIDVIDYKQYDMNLHSPEVIFVQNHNKVDEFSKDYYREYFNMQYYVTVPDVVNADKVLVQSDNLRGLYIDKLTDWAGEDTRKLSYFM